MPSTQYLIDALVGAALALLVSGRTFDWAFGLTPISMSVLGVVILSCERAPL